MVAFAENPEPSEYTLKIYDAFLITRDYIDSKDQHPLQEEMNNWFEEYTGDNSIVRLLMYERATDERYLPALLGEIPKDSYILAYWRSEWMEEFAPWSGKTTMCAIEKKCYSFSSSWYWTALYFLISLGLGWLARITRPSN